MRTTRCLLISAQLSQETATLWGPFLCHKHTHNTHACSCHIPILSSRLRLYPTLAARINMISLAPTHPELRDPPATSLGFWRVMKQRTSVRAQEEWETRFLEKCVCGRTCVCNKDAWTKGNHSGCFVHIPSPWPHLAKEKGTFMPNILH